MTAPKKKSKRITPRIQIQIQHLNARCESLAAQLLEVQSSCVEAMRKLKVEREMGRIRLEGYRMQHNVLVNFQKETIHRLLGYEEPSMGETSYKPMADKVQQRWIDKVPHTNDFAK
jgi:hypothetical protein